MTENKQTSMMLKRRTQQEKHALNSFNCRKRKLTTVYLGQSIENDVVNFVCIF